MLINTVFDPLAGLLIALAALGLAQTVLTLPVTINSEPELQSLLGGLKVGDKSVLCSIPCT